MKGSHRRAVSTAACSLVAMGTMGGPPPVAAAAPDGRIVARTDVDGDGRRDVVRFRVVADDHAVVAVATARGAHLTQHLRTDWITPQWHGAARMDGRSGAELVVITNAGAHTLFHTVLTVRNHELVGLNAPGRGRTWVTDGAAFVNIGWKRYVKQARVFMVKRSVTKDGDRWSGRALKYRWSRDEWRRVSSSRLHPRSDRKASRFGGWQVRGLPRY